MGLTVHTQKEDFLFLQCLLIGSSDGVTERTEEVVCMEELSREGKGRSLSCSKMEGLHFSGEKPQRSQ